MSSIAQIILAAIQAAPQAIPEIIALYDKVKGTISTTDQADIDAALAKAQADDATATAQADTALDAAANK